MVEVEGQRNHILDAMKPRNIFLISGLVTFVVLAAVFAVFQVTDNRAVTASTGSAEIGGPFQLTDQDGRQVDESLLQDRLNVIYFGYTFCPDVCPTTLQDISTALDMMGEDGDQVQSIFITVDPERDTVEVVKDYVGWFRPGTVGLTGSVEQVEAVKAAYKVYSTKAPQEDDETGENYLVDHTSITYVMGPDGSFVTHFSHGTSPEDMAKKLGDLL